MNLGILLWNKCNATCAHCMVSSSPTEPVLLSDEQIFALIEQSFEDGARPHIGLSGGEAFMFIPRLCRIISYATTRGAWVAVNTNGFWAKTQPKALEVVTKVREAGLCKLVVSWDSFHAPFIEERHVINAISACKELGQEVRFQFAVTKKTERLKEFTDRHPDVFKGVECSEILCLPVGRAAEEVDLDDLFVQSGIPKEKCPAASLTVSPSGKLMPCCNGAGYLPSMQLGTVGQPLAEVNAVFRSSAVLKVLTTEGPATLVSAAMEGGFVPRQAGYVSPCDLCYDLFRDPKIAGRVKEEAASRVASELFDSH